MQLSITGANYIGQKNSQSGSTTFKTFSCRSQKENDAVFHSISEDELEEVLQKAADCSQAYALSSIERRRQFLHEIIHLLEEHRTTLVHQFCEESSLLVDRADVELTRTQKQIKTYIDVISRENWEVVSNEVVNGVSFEKKHFPLGAVVVFGASNFPFAYSTIGGDVASALAAGNPVIYKANPFHAGVSEMVTQIILKAAKRAFLPDGVFSLVQGGDYWIGEKLLKDERVKAVGFTGSVRGGVALLNYAKERTIPIPVFCEMGSLNPTFIFKDALDSRMDEMVEKLAFAIKNDAGQFCTKPGLIFVEGEKAKTFIAKVQAEFETAAAIPMLHPSIYEAYMRLSATFEKYTIIQNPQEALKYSAKPTLAVLSFEEFLASKEAKEEVFGPFSVIVTCSDTNEMKQGASIIGGHLTASFWTEETLSEEWLYWAGKSVGRIIRNGVPTGVEVIDSMHHGGNFPATSDSRFTAVGKDAIYRFLQPVTLQGF